MCCVVLCVPEPGSGARKKEENMTRKSIAILLCVLLLLSFAGCGKSGSQSSPPAGQAGNQEQASGPSYMDIYLKYLTVCGALMDETERRLETNNAILESKYPNSYYMDSNYLMLVYVPFNTVYPSLASPLAEDNVSAAQAALRASFPDAQLTKLEPGKYEAVYTYVDKTSGEALSRDGRCVWEWDGVAGSFKVTAFVDGELVEFTEFVPQGNDEYLLYTMTDRALVRYANGAVTGLWHAHRISEPPLSRFGGDMRVFTLAWSDPYPRGTVTKEEIVGGEDADDLQYTLVLENDVMTYTGKISQDLTA